MKNVLLLNASEEVLGLISMQRAVGLFMSGKVRPPVDYDHVHEIKTVSGVFELPSALILVRYVRVPYRKLSITRDRLLERDNYSCQYCNRDLTKNTVTIDHVIPQSKGGPHKWTNVVASCVTCNTTKGSKSLAQFKKVTGKYLKKIPEAPAREFAIVIAVDKHTLEVWQRWFS